MPNSLVVEAYYLEKMILKQIWYHWMHNFLENNISKILFGKKVMDVLSFVLINIVQLGINFQKVKILCF